MISPKNASLNVTRATRILLALGQVGPKGRSLAELTAILGDAKPAVHRALQSMLETGFVSQNGRRGNYLLGPAIYGLAHRTPSVNELVALMRPSLLDIAGTTGYCAYLMMRAGHDSLCIDVQPGRIVAPSFVEGIGGRVPLGLGMAGISLLGQLDAESTSRILAANAHTYAACGLTEACVRDEIAQYYMRGYALGKRKTGTFSNMCVAFPVDAGMAGFDAAVSVILPDSEEHIARCPEVITTVRDILMTKGARAPAIVF